MGSAATGKPLVEHWNGRAWKQVPAASPRGATESLLTSVAATGSSNAWAVGYYNTGTTIKTLIERWDGRWAKVASPNPGGVHGSFLLGVTAAGPSDAWAVGYFSTGKTIKTLIERWNGHMWAQVASPSPRGLYAQRSERRCGGWQVRRLGGWLLLRPAGQAADRALEWPEVEVRA